MTLTNICFTLDAFIMEEYEKAERRVPQWKIQWVKDNLKNMIGEEDKELNKSAIKRKPKASLRQSQRTRTKK